jgi:hypothetical protein
MLGKKLKPETAEDTILSTTPAGMRTLIQRHLLYNPLIHNIYSMSVHADKDMSTEDLMTILAFNAIVQLEAAQDRVLDMCNRCSRNIIIKEA